MKISKPFLLSSLLVLLSSIIIASVFIKTPQNSKDIITMTEEQENGASIFKQFGVKIDKNPPQSKLDELQVNTWSKWSGQPMKIPWTFEAEETMYLLEGKVKVSVDGQEGSFEIGGGDLVVFPNGMKITWEVLEAVTKHYHLKK
ncbi:uncharacterized protein LOC110713967 [Chenopodium quinoa]|uniref:(S)-ureidoglycine aminohydrolase cupin domain-containing protein n=1 Tax=Chenopodium quinoa TaxID=63459 RepID=A0A803KYU0_CHEQI|nr:uncharacterized protein LOC110713967 [Chenopodium quinoa]